MLSEFYSEGSIDDDRIILFSRLFYDNNVNKIVYCTKRFFNHSNATKPILRNIRWDLINNGKWCEKRGNKWFISYTEIIDEIFIKNLNIYERKLKLEKLLEK